MWHLHIRVFNKTIIIFSSQRLGGHLVKNFRLFSIALLFVLVTSTWAPFPAYAQPSSTLNSTKKPKLTGVRIWNATSGTLSVRFDGENKYFFVASKWGKTYFPNAIKPGKYEITFTSSYCPGSVTIRRQVKGANLTLPRMFCRSIPNGSPLRLHRWFTLIISTLTCPSPAREGHLLSVFQHNVVWGFHRYVLFQEHESGLNPYTSQHNSMMKETRFAEQYQCHKRLPATTLDCGLFVKKLPKSPHLLTGINPVTI